MEHEQQEKSDCIFSTYDGSAELAVSVLVSAAGALGGSPGVVEDEERRDLHRRRGSSCNSDTAATGCYTATGCYIAAICSPASRCRPSGRGRRGRSGKPRWRSEFSLLFSVLPIY